MSEARLAPLPDADWPEAIADMQAGFAGGLNVYRVMAHHPDLLRAWAPLREHLVNRPALGAELSEVAILRTAHRLGASYEWQQHIERARARGLRDARIASIAGALRDMAGDDALIARAVDELLDDHALSAATLRALTEAFGKTAGLDLMATVGFYSILGWILNTHEVPLDADIAERLAQNPLTPA
jgi:alkylhydroperoxidase family enzyme